MTDWDAVYNRETPAQNWYEKKAAPIMTAPHTPATDELMAMMETRALEHSSVHELSGNVLALLARIDADRAVAEAAVRYDEAIQSCADDPGRMSSYCTAQGDDLDTLYDDWISKSRAALAAYQEGAPDA